MIIVKRPRADKRKHKKLNYNRRSGSGDDKGEVILHTINIILFMLIMEVCC